ncbi:glycosyltransferase family 4 protein [Pedobacter aquae]|jgi:glycosyltransferase involved in cell wall biosynthesis|uniref:Glycosyltransferase family 4 protein n=1 Tax=Pedobacter aquae TaxID=2605747 RepID=A0A5C0VJE7_9SPHI|nr:glycosyltransferase [Pedobacter aquae]QEK52207.1 glycosyltransferase family 4 protein [Pedobacter aquae]
MNISYFYRSPKAGYSIGKVFRTLVTEVSNRNNVNEYVVPARRADVLSLIRNIIFVFKNRNRKGINHITGDIHYCMLGLIGCRTVLTVHDLSMLDCETNIFKKKLIKLLWFTIPFFLAEKVVCISHHTYNQVVKLVDSNKVRMIHNPVDPSFKYSPKSFNISCPAILQVGTGWNKNLDNIIEVIRDFNCTLIIIGSVALEQELRMKDYGISYLIKEGLSDIELISEYQACDIVSFCSIYEGFGMPIIEGNAIGRCVLTSDIEPMPEVAGDAACFVDPRDKESILKGLIKITSDHKYRFDLIEAGKSNAERFNINRIAHLYELVYMELSHNLN